MNERVFNAIKSCIIWSAKPAFYQSEDNCLVCIPDILPIEREGKIVPGSQIKLSFIQNLAQDKIVSYTGYIQLGSQPMQEFDFQVSNPDTEERRLEAFITTLIEALIELHKMGKIKLPYMIDRMEKYSALCEYLAIQRGESYDSSDIEERFSTIKDGIATKWERISRM